MWSEDFANGSFPCSCCIFTGVLSSPICYFSKLRCVPKRRSICSKRERWMKIECSMFWRKSTKYRHMNFQIYVEWLYLSMGFKTKYSTVISTTVLSFYYSMQEHHCWIFIISQIFIFYLFCQNLCDDKTFKLHLDGLISPPEVASVIIRHRLLDRLLDFSNSLSDGIASDNKRYVSYGYDTPFWHKDA